MFNAFTGVDEKGRQQSMVKDRAATFRRGSVRCLVFHITIRNSGGLLCVLYIGIAVVGNTMMDVDAACVGVGKIAMTQKISFA